MIELRKYVRKEIRELLFVHKLCGLMNGIFHSKSFDNFSSIEWVDKSDAKRLLRRIRFNAPDQR